MATAGENKTTAGACRLGQGCGEVPTYIVKRITGTVGTNPTTEVFAPSAHEAELAWLQTHTLAPGEVLDVGRGHLNRASHSKHHVQHVDLSELTI